MPEISDAEYNRLKATEDGESYVMRWVGRSLKIIASAVVFVLLVTFTYDLVKPQLRLYKANVEKKSAVAEAKAHANAAVFLADAEITRAGGVAKANEIIASSITDSYVRWLYVDQLDEIHGQIIYVPTEAGIPILESTRNLTPAGD